MEDVGGGAQEGEEQEDEAYLGALGAGLEDGHCGALERGKGRGFFLNLHFGLLQLGYHLLVDLLLHLHLNLQLCLFGLATLRSDCPMGVGISGIALTSLLVFGLGL